MAKARLGRAERAIKKAYFDNRKAHNRAIIEANLNAPKPKTIRYATVGDYRGSMTHGLYRGLYDPYMSSLKETRRGFKVPKHKSIKEAKAGPVKPFT